MLRACLMIFICGIFMRSAAQEQPIFTVSASDVTALNAAFAETDVGKLLWHERLQGLRDFIDAQIRREMPVLAEIKTALTAVQIQVLVTDNRRQPLAFRGQLNGDFSGLTQEYRAQLQAISAMGRVKLFIDDGVIVLSQIDSVEAQDIDSQKGIYCEWSVTAAAPIIVAMQHGRDALITQKLLQRVPNGSLSINFADNAMQSRIHLNTIPVGLAAIDLVP